MTRVYLDTNIFLYAIGDESDYRAPCREVLAAARARRLTAESSALTIEEVFHHRSRRRDGHAARRAREVAHMCDVVHAVDQSITLAALAILEARPRFKAADAFHLATALAAGLTLLVSADADFDDVAGIERVDPLDRSRLGEICGG